MNFNTASIITQSKIAGKALTQRRTKSYTNPSFVKIILPTIIQYYYFLFRVVHSATIILNMNIILFGIELLPAKITITVQFRFVPSSIAKIKIKVSSSASTSKPLRFLSVTKNVYEKLAVVVHDKKICLYNHNSKDRRRGNFETYQHV
jgi:hypothetical protein